MADALAKAWARADLSVWLAVKTSALVVGALNAAGFLITATTKTHKITDLTGTTAFTLSSLATLMLVRSAGTTTGAGGPRRQTLAYVLAICVACWGSRLGGHLFNRILRTGTDARLEPFFLPEHEGMPFPLKLAGFWSIQALWGFIGVLPVTIVHGVAAAAAATPASSDRAPAATLQRAVSVRPTTVLALLSFALWLGVESVADYQKDAFKSIPGHEDKWVKTGLFEVARYPAYAGEMGVWWSLWCAMGATLMMRYKLAVLSPLLVTGLLLRVSGIPLLEKQQQRKYGADPAFADWKAQTNLLWPFALPGSGSSSG